MKHTASLFAIGFWAMLAPVQAAVVQARWDELCRVAGTNQLNVTTADGITESGHCLATRNDELSLEANQRIVKIARSTLTRIQMYDPGNGHRLADLGNGMAKSFKAGFRWLFSPAAPLGLIAIPSTIAWGLVAAPFCALGDMGSHGPTTQDVKLTN